MRTIRRFVYALGIRPKSGSIFYSPSRALLLALKEADVAVAFARGLAEGRAARERQ